MQVDYLKVMRRRAHLAWRRRKLSHRALSADEIGISTRGRSTPSGKLAAMSGLKLVIGNKNYSSWSMRPWLLMRQLGIEFREVQIPLRQPDSLERKLSYSPAGKVPTLIDGDLHIWDSLAIIERLAEKFPEKRIWPTDPEARALARSVSAEMHSGFCEPPNAYADELPRSPPRCRPRPRRA
jgi:hypothetical protein